ncbi:DUF3040 domain-containing protein [Pseudonocardia sp. GCM10023141]|uniref:DUF3040 domain-containing protein n=1 Tax=Pseudonocardia sp. GCM10023141 TaxID=3252653 RepID=UPI0036207BE8
MGIRSASGPDETNPLSARELLILADIERDLHARDPRLAKRLTRCGAGRIWGTLSPWQLLAVAPVLGVVLLVLAVLVPGSLVAALLLLLSVSATVWAMVGADYRADR